MHTYQLIKLVRKEISFIWEGECVKQRVHIPNGAKVSVVNSIGSNIK